MRGEPAPKILTQPLHLPAHQAVVVAAECIHRNHRLPAARELPPAGGHPVGVLGAIAGRNHQRASSPRKEHRGLQAELWIARHIIHPAMETGCEPLQQTRFGLRHIHFGQAPVIKPLRLCAGVDPPKKFCRPDVGGSSTRNIRRGSRGGSLFSDRSAIAGAALHRVGCGANAGRRFTSRI